jgi:hypothetical protein
METKYTDLHRTDHGTESFSTGALEKGGKKTGKITERKKIHARGTRKRAIRNKNGKKNICK